MKKLIFLLLMAVVLAGFVSAGAVHPPWVESPETADVILAEYGIHEGIVTQPTVLVSALPKVEQSSFLAVVVHDNLSTQPISYFISISLDTGQSCIACAIKAVDYYLRL